MASALPPERKRPERERSKLGPALPFITEILDTVEKNARQAQLSDDLCARSTMEGLKSCFDFIPEDMVSASMSLAAERAPAAAVAGRIAAACSLLG